MPVLALFMVKTNRAGGGAFANGRRAAMQMNPGTDKL